MNALQIFIDSGLMGGVLIAELDFPLDVGIERGTGLFTGTWDWNILIPRPYQFRAMPIHSQVWLSYCCRPLVQVQTQNKTP